ELTHEALVEVDGLPYRNDWIRQTLEEDQFPAAVSEFSDIARDCAVERRPEGGVDLHHVLFDVERAPVPVGAEHPLEETIKSRLARGVAGRLDEAPIEDPRLAARQFAIEEGFAVLVGGAEIDCLCGLHLFRSQAIIGRGALAGERSGV